MVIANFTSKVNTLKFLQEKITRSEIEQSFDFTIEEWQKSELIILNEVMKIFNGSLVVIRSSAVGEDTIEKSEAGNFTSVLNVSSTSKTKLKK